MTTKLSLRPWRKSDAEFIINLRNKPELMRWFRQGKYLSVYSQEVFMNSLEGFTYNGKIILLNGKRIGVGAVKATGELTLVLPNKYKLYRREIIKKLIGKLDCVWGEVFEGNDITWDLEQVGFKPIHTLYKYERIHNKS